MPIGTRCRLALSEEDPQGNVLPWRDWLAVHFPAVCTQPFAPRHVRLWEWFDSLEPGSRPRPRVEVWGRGGAKSSSAELGCVRVGVKLSRRFALYLSDTQEMADRHVQSIATLFESAGVERALGKYGHSKGWRRDQLRTATGFNVAALGLDTAARGIKLDQYRPDLIIADDIDHSADSQKTIEKKLNILTTALIPAGSSDCAILFVQNLVHEESIVSQLVDGRADFLHDREVPEPEPAVIGLQTETVTREDGAKVYRINGGTATWEGQSLEVCERQINDWGLRAFLREAQHEVAGADGYFFNVSQLQYLDASDVPADLKLCRAWDLAATEGGGDWTAGVLIGLAKNGAVYLLDVQRGQWGSDRVRAMIKQTAEADKRRGKVALRLPQDPGQAGKDQAVQMGQAFSAFSPVILPITGQKSTRAEGLAEKVNSGNVTLVNAEWNRAFRDELRKFKEDELHQTDDQVDAAADAFNHLVPPVSWWSDPATLDRLKARHQTQEKKASS